jgi:hypothetical protein
MSNTIKQRVTWGLVGAGAFAVLYFVLAPNLLMFLN